MPGALAVIVLLVCGLLLLVAADLVLASSAHWSVVLVGVGLWGMHMGMTQGLLATMVADAAPAELRGTAYGCFNLVSGIALLVASVIAGLLWDRLGASYTFHAGAAFSLLAVIALLLRGRTGPRQGESVHTGVEHRQPIEPVQPRSRLDAFRIGSAIPPSRHRAAH